MGVFHEACKGFELPKMYRVRQIFDDEHIGDGEVYEYVQRALTGRAPDIRPGMSVAVTAGSRGIRNITEILKSVCDYVRSKSAAPFIIPAMGSHGGATAAGQLEILRDYGITEETMGCPIRATMETRHVGDTEDGHRVYTDLYACQADGVIVVNRVKPHTAFRGPFESGLMKMMTIGMGNQRGAESLHETGFGDMARLMPMYARVIMESVNIVCGVAILENANEHTCEIAALSADDIPRREPELLLKAKALMPRLLFDETDVLVIDKIGKNFSGDGHDPNISGRFLTPYASGGIRSQRLVILDLSDETHGNGSGVGLADIVTRRLIDKLDYEKVFSNSLTNTVLHAANTPPWTESDHDAICLGVRTCNNIDKSRPRIIRIANTLAIGEIEISEALLEEARRNPCIEVIGEGREMVFDEKGDLF